jgi:hypothetical protein
MCCAAPAVAERQWLRSDSACGATVVMERQWSWSDSSRGAALGWCESLPSRY